MLAVARATLADVATGWLVQLPLERVFEPSNIPRTSSTYESADRPAPSSSSAEARARALAFEFICPLVKTLCEFVGADAERLAHVFDVGGNRSQRVRIVVAAERVVGGRLRTRA